jgi:uncharacterized protein YciI
MDFDHFSIALLTLRDDAPAMSEAQERALQDAHLDHLARLHEAGQLLAAGPVGGDSPYVGLSILTVGVDEARALKEADPAVIAGRLAVVVLPWMVPAGAVAFRSTRFPHSVADVRGG